MEGVFHIYIAHTIWENNSLFDLKIIMLWVDYIML